MVNLSDIRVVLVGTTHPGNIGAAARAMKVMGLSRLHLVAPRVHPSAEATAMASSADDLLAKAAVHDSLEPALEGCGLVLGTSARLRSLSLPQLDARAAAGRAVNESGSQPVALLFGREKSGLSNAEMDRCHFLVHIPVSQEYQSLNLAQAVQILAYEIRMAACGDEHEAERQPLDWQPEPADRMEVFYQRLETMLVEIGFLNPAQPKRLMQRLRRLFQRARPDQNELNILNGIVSAARQSASGAREGKIDER